MCGIVAIWSGERDHALHAMESALKELGHRGPDSADSYWTDSGLLLGHTRLAIQDPEHGSQPTALQAGHLSFNGEVYNYPELREELAELGVRFTEHGDTEVVARALDHWGDEALNRFNGDFSIAYTAGNTLTIARDRFGVKPLYYWHDNVGLVVASEPKAIFAALKHLRPSFTPTLDKNGLVDCTLYGVSVAPFSLYEGIRTVEPGTFTRIQRTDAGLTFDETRYWDVTISGTTRPTEALAEDIRTTLKDAVRIRLRSDVGSAVMLSGGLDSSIITYAAGEETSLQRRRAYTIGDPTKESDNAGTFMTGSDLDFARIVASESGHELTVNTKLVDDPARWVRECARARDAVVSLGSEIGMCKLLSQIGERERVILSGDGADEVFLGYAWQIGTKGSINQYYSAKGARFLPLLYHRSFMRPRDASARGKRSFRARTQRLSGNVVNKPENFIHYLQLRFTLPYLLDRLDTIAMAHSVEVRVPYLDHRLVDLAVNAPADVRFGAREKELLRQAFAGHYNSAVVDRSKSVFPYGESPEYLNLLRREVQDLLVDDNSIIREVYNRVLLRAVFGSARRFEMFARAVGVFYAHAFMCQLISLDELHRVHGLAV